MCFKVVSRGYNFMLVCFFLARSNFLGTKFIVYDGQPPHAGAKMTRSRSTRLANLKQVSPRIPFGNYSVAHISYELNVLGSRYKFDFCPLLLLRCNQESINYYWIFVNQLSQLNSKIHLWTFVGQLMLKIFYHMTIRGPRRMQCVMDSIPASAIESGGVAPTQTEFLFSNADSFPSIPFFRSKSNRSEKFLSGPLACQKDGALVLRNKAPRWHEQLQCWCLNFHGRVTVASVKNFQLVASPENGPAGLEHEKIILQFGKVGKDLFTMDYRYPISAFQAFAICLSSFDTKIACEWYLAF